MVDFTESAAVLRLRGRQLHLQLSNLASTANQAISGSGIMKI
jgi:hypothetical protein